MKRRLQGVKFLFLYTDVCSRFFRYTTPPQKKKLQRFEIQVCEEKITGMMRADGFIWRKVRLDCWKKHKVQIVKEKKKSGTDVPFAGFYSSTSSRGSWSMPQARSSFLMLSAHCCTAIFSVSVNFCRTVWWTPSFPRTHGIDMYTSLSIPWEQLWNG